MPRNRLKRACTQTDAAEGTIATLLRHSGTVLVRRYAHLSVSHLQDEIEKVSAFGKVTD